MLALENRPRIRQSRLKSSGDRRRLQAARAVYNTRLHFEPLEDRRLLSVVTYTTATKLLDFSADAGKSDNVTVSTPAANQIQIMVGNGDAIALAGDAISNPDFVLSTTTTANDTLTISTAPANSPLATFNINLGDQEDTLAFGLANATNGVADVNIDGGTGADVLNLSTSTLGGSLTVSAQTGTTNLSGTITTAGAQTYNGPVILAADATLTSTGSGNITFNSTVDSDTAATPRAMTLNTSGTIQFGDGAGNDYVGGVNPLAALTISYGATTVFDVQGSSAATPTVTTVNDGGAATGNQTFNGVLRLQLDTILASTYTGAASAGGNIVLNNTVDSYDNAAANARALTVDTSGLTQFSGDVGSVNPLSGLTTDQAGAPASQVGGTTSFGASYVAASTAYSFQDISSTGTLLNSLHSQDDAYAQINLPAGVSFPFYGQNYTSLFASTNGLITFGSPNTEYSNTDLTTDPSQATIAVFWDDLVTYSSPNANVFYQVFGSGASAQLVVQWNGIAFISNSNSSLTFEAVLGADGSIGLNYQKLSVGDSRDLGASATVGVKDANGAGHAPLLLVYDNGPTALLNNNKSILISPPPATVAVTTVNNNGTAAGAQTYNDAVQLQLDTVLTSNVAAPATTGGNITFASTVDGAQALTVNTSGVTTFGGPVGSTTPLTSLTTDAAGETDLNGGVVTTTGAQDYQDKVVLTADTTLTGVGITFEQTLDSDATARALAINDSGTTLFKDKVGDGSALGSLTTDAAGETDLNGGVVTTTGAQDYQDKVALTADTTLTGVGITFEQTLDSDATARALAINDSGTTLFKDNVGDGSALSSLTTDAAGATQINGGTVTTTGVQTYHDPVTQGTDTHFTGSTLTVGPSWDAASHSLWLTFSGAVTVPSVFTNVVNFTSDGTGGTTIAGSFTTSGYQTYSNAAALTADATLTSGTDITFTAAGTINLNGHILSFNSSGTNELDGVISGAGGLTFNGYGQSFLNAANTYTGVTTVNSGTLVVENEKGLGATGTGNGTDVENYATLQLQGPITVTGEILSSSSSAYIGSVGDNVWTGDMTVANNLYGQIATGNSLKVTGNITAAYLSNNDVGLLILGGSANAIQYYVYNYGGIEVDGTLSVLNGYFYNWNGATLEVDGTLSTPNGYVYNFNGATLQGTGTVNAGAQYSYNYGTLDPGLTIATSAPGILNTGNIYSGGNFNVRLNGPGTAGTDYDQLNVTGSVQLGGTLNVSLGVGYTPTIGDSFVILSNDGTDPISGNFSGLPQDSLLVVGAAIFQISYTGGADGNDVVLTSTAADVWTGADNGLGGSNNWSDGANWLGGVAPHAGDRLLFPDGALQPSNVNDFTAADSAFGMIQIAGSGYSLTGNQVLLEGNIVSEGTGNSVGLNLQLSADEGIVNANAAGATFKVSGAIDLDGHNLSLSATDSSGITELDGQISGAGGLTIGGSGQSALNADNLYTGVTTVNSGTLVVENEKGLGATGTGNETDVENYATLQLAGSIAVAGELLTSSSNASVSSVGDNVWNGDMAVANELDVYIDSGDSLHVGGNITGQYLDLNTYNGGTLVLGGLANVLQYQVYNYYDILEVDGSLSVPNGYVYNYGTLLGTGTVSTGSSSYPIYNSGTLAPGTAAAPGILNTSTIYVYSSGNFNARLNGDAAGTQYDQLNVTGTVTLSGNLNVSLGYAPAMGKSFVILSNDGTDAISGAFNGLPQGSLLVAGGDVFQISYTGNDGNDVVLTRVAADIWTGADNGLGGSNNWSDGANWLGGVAPHSGDRLLFPDGALQPSNVNDFSAADSAFSLIQIAGSGYSLTGNPVSLAGNIVSAGTGNSLGLNLQLSTDEGIFNANAASSIFTVSGTIDLNGHNLSVSAANSSGITDLDGQISGAGGLTISGSGQSVLNADNLYTGVTTVNSGTLVVENEKGLGATGTGNGTDVENNATLQLKDSITVAGELLTSSSNATISSVDDNAWNGDIAVHSQLSVNIANGNSLELGGNITGQYLYLSTYNGGPLVLGASANATIQYQVYNYYSILEVDGTLSTPNGYIYNYGTFQGTGTINTSSLSGYVYNYGALDPGLTIATSAPGILNTGNIYSGGNFNVRLNGPGTAGTDYDQLDVTGSVQLGGNLNVTLGVGYTPTIGDSFVILSNDGADPISGAFNGLAQGSLLVVGADVFQISYTGGADGNDVVLTSTAADVWTGADNGLGGSNNWSDGANWLGGVAPHAGDRLLFPDGALQPSNVNDFTGTDSAFSLIQIAGSGYSLTGNQVLLEGNIVSAGTGNSLGLNLQLSTDEGIVNANAAGATFKVSGAIDLDGHNLSLSATDSSGITELDGQISGAGGLTIGGSGQSVLNATNSYTGVTTVNSGTLVVENEKGLGATGTGNETDVENNATLQLAGSIAVAGELLTSSSNASVSSVGDNVWNGDMAVANELDVYIDSGNALHVGGNITGQYLYLSTYNGGALVLGGSANVLQYQVYNYYNALEVDGSLSVPNGYVYNYGTLQGTGTVNSGTQYSYNYGTLSPGLTIATSAPGILNTGNIYSGGNFNVRLNGPDTAGTDYDQLDVTGSVQLGGNLNVALGYTPTIGDTYMIIKNDGTDAVSGTFTGLDEGATISAGGYNFQISYVGGTGNDVVLTALTGNPDTTAPTATIDRALGQADVTAAGTIHFTVVFSKMISGFTASDIVFTGSTDAGLLTATLDTSDQITFDVAVTGMTNDGPVTIGFAPGAATDGGGLGNLAPTVIDNTVTYDTTPPTVLLSAPSASITAGGPITYTVTYVDANLGAITLTSADVTLNVTGTAAATTVAVSSLTSTTELVTISGITGDGTLGISIDAGTAVDLAGNTALASAASATFTVDNTPPTVTLSTPSASITAGGPITYTVTYVDANLGAITLTSADVTLNVTGTAAATTVAVSSLTSTTELVTISGITGNGTLGISLVAGTAADLAGNPAPAAGPSATFTVVGEDTIGLFAPVTSTFYLRNSNTAGVADTTFWYGPAGLPANSQWIPIAGDWNGDGTDTVGLYNPVTSVFYLKNNLAGGNADTTFQYGPSGLPAGSRWTPIAGDWDGNGSVTIGLYNPATSMFYLKNSLAGGNADLTFQYGPSGLPAGSQWTPIVGDWTGDGKDTVGLYNPTNSNFYLKNTNTAGVADATFWYGPVKSGWKPIASDWDADGKDTVGLYSPTSSVFYLKNSLAGGNADLTFQYGPAGSGWTPLAGNWTLAGQPLMATNEVVSSNAAVLTQASLQPIVNEAIARWAAAGVDAASLAKLTHVQVAIADLPGSYLGNTVGNAITIDRDAAGHGWFVDSTPALDEEFAPSSSQGTMRAIDVRAVDRIDLLSVVEHEMGHLLGYDHADDGLMTAVLPLGVRRIAAVDQVFATLPGV